VREKLNSCIVIEKTERENIKGELEYCWSDGVRKWTGLI